MNIGLILINITLINIINLFKNLISIIIMPIIEIVKNNCNLLCSHVSAKFRDDLLIGTEHSYKVIPKCNTPQQQFLRTESQANEINTNFKIMEWNC